jgi:hypothetical protein
MERPAPIRSSWVTLCDWSQHTCARPVCQGPRADASHGHVHQARPACQSVTVEPGRIEVRFGGGQVGRLFALAQVLTNDFESFEMLVTTHD